MKIEIYRLDELQATAEADGPGEIKWQGPDAAGLRRVAQRYRHRLKVEGEDLLRALLQHLNGMLWAQEVK